MLKGIECKNYPNFTLKKRNHLQSDLKLLKIIVLITQLLQVERYSASPKAFFDHFDWLLFGFILLGTSQKTPHLKTSFLPSPLFNLQTVQVLSPLFQAIRPFIQVFGYPPPVKIGFFNEPLYLNFASLTPSLLLKVTKFLVKVFQ